MKRMRSGCIIFGMIVVFVFGLGLRQHTDLSRFEEPLRAPLEMRVVSLGEATQKGAGWVALPSEAVMKSGASCAAYLTKVDQLTGLPDFKQAAAEGVARFALRQHYRLMELDVIKVQNQRQNVDDQTVEITFYQVIHDLHPPQADLKLSP